jgi:hypothetical protein
LVVLSILLVTGCNATKLFEPIETALHPVPGAVNRLVKLRAMFFIALARNRQTNAATTQIAPNLTTAIPFVADDSIGT